jgi:cell division protein FtsB
MQGAELQAREDRAAYVRFERVPVEDKKASLEQGRYVAKDVDFALITPPYSRDVIRIKVKQWLENMDNDERNGRIPAAWVQNYKKAHQAWMNGQEMPLHGTAIRGWGVISPAQQETLLRLNILTVEDLAGINDEGAKRIGMGAIEMKHKAAAWLKQLSDRGPLTQENAALKQQVAALQATVETLSAQMAQLKRSQGVAEVEPDESISTAAELLDDDEPVQRRQRSRKNAQ